MKKKVLVVDDSDLLHKIYPSILKRHKDHELEILHALNGQEALGQLAQHPDTDLVLLDINMPVMSGLEFLKHRQSEEVFLDVPVVVVSTRGREQDIQSGVEAGAMGYLTKPFKADELLGLIGKVFESQATGAASASKG